MNLAEEALPEVFYGFDAHTLYALKCCCSKFKQVIEHREHLQQKIDLYKANTLAEARSYVHKNDMDFAFADLLGNTVIYPCATTRAILDAINSVKIQHALKASGVDPAILARKCSEEDAAIVGCIKGGGHVDTLVECFKFYGIHPASWINNDEQRYTVLHYAARYNRLDIIKLCVETFHCDVNALTHTNNNALHYAVHSSREIRAYLIEAGCDTTRVNVFGHLPPTADGDPVEIPSDFAQTFRQVLSRYTQ